jgi:acyl CoA:acetate/3-ketoacid CoA transferase alpha subunit
MTTAEWSLVVAVGAQGVGLVVALVRLAVWGSSAHARMDARVQALEAKVDNDISGRRIVAEMKSDVAVIKATLADVKEHVRTLDGRFAGFQAAERAE